MNLTIIEITRIAYIVLSTTVFIVFILHLKKQKLANPSQLFWPIILLATSFALLLFLGYQIFVDTISFEKSRGEVVEYVQVDNWLYAKIKYVDNSGNEQVGTSVWGENSQNYKIGETVPLLYDSNDPTKIKISYKLIYSILTYLIVFFGGFGLVYHFKKLPRSYFRNQ